MAKRQAIESYTSECDLGPVTVLEFDLHKSVSCFNKSKFVHP